MNWTIFRLIKDCVSLLRISFINFQLFSAILLFIFRTSTKSWICIADKWRSLLKKKSSCKKISELFSIKLVFCSLFCIEFIILLEIYEPFFQEYINKINFSSSKKFSFNVLGRKKSSSMKKRIFVQKS